MAVKAVKKDAAKPADAEAATAAPKKGKGKLILIAVVLLAVIGGGAAWWFLHQKSADHDAKPAALKPAVFQPLDSFTVNLQIEDNPQFLQTAITLKVTDTEGADAIKARMPEVRNTVLLLLSGRKPSQILNVEGKRKLGVEIVTAVNAIFNPSAPRPAANAPAATPPPDAAETPAAAAEPPEAAAAASPAKSQAPVLDVLFTSFIIQ